MNVTVSHIADSGIVEIVASGLVDHDARKEIISTAWAALDQTDFKRLLINKAESTRFFDKQMSGALGVIKLMTELNFSRHTAIAVLHNRLEPYDEFFEVMAQLKDFSVKSFTSRDAAISWLCQECR